MIDTCLAIAEDIGQGLPAGIAWYRPRQSSETACFARLESVDIAPTSIEPNDSPIPGKLRTYLSGTITIGVVVNGDEAQLEEQITALEAGFEAALKNNVEKKKKIDYYYTERMALNPIEGENAGRKWFIQFDLRIGRNTSSRG